MPYLVSLLLFFQLCFAYKGPFASHITVNIYYTDTDGATRSVGRGYTFSRASNLEIWNHVCMDVYKKIIDDSWFTSRVSTSPKYRVGFLRANKDGSSLAPMYIDDIWIGSSAMTGKDRCSIFPTHSRSTSMLCSYDPRFLICKNLVCSLCF